MRKFVSLIIIFIMLFSSISFAMDDSYSSWAKEHIEKANEYKIIPNELNANYKRDITRQEFASLVVRLVEKITEKEIDTTSNPFTDTDDIDVIKAYSYEIVNGIGVNKFGPNNKITREQIGVMLIRAIAKIYVNEDLDVLQKAKIDEFKFADEEEISDWAMPYIQLAYKNKIITGVGNNKIAPLGNTTREQSIVLAKRIYEMFNSEQSKETIKVYWEFNEFEKDHMPYTEVFLILEGRGKEKISIGDYPGEVSIIDSPERYGFPKDAILPIQLYFAGFADRLYIKNLDNHLEVIYRLLDEMGDEIEINILETIPLPDNIEIKFGK